MKDFSIIINTQTSYSDNTPLLSIENLTDEIIIELNSGNNSSVVELYDNDNLLDNNQLSDTLNKILELFLEYKLKIIKKTNYSLSDLSLIEKAISVLQEKNINIIRK